MFSATAFTASVLDAKSLVQKIRAMEPTAWYDPSDLSTLWQDSAGTTPVAADGDPIGRMDDKSGNGNHVTQATADNRPLYKTSGGLHWVQGDGVDDWLRASFTFGASGFDRVSAIRQLSWTSSDRIFGPANLSNFGFFYQNGTTPELALFDGMKACSNTDAAVGADVVATERHNGASSRLAINNGAYATGNPGGPGSPGGVTIFADGAGGASGNVRLYGLVIKDGALTDTETTTCRRYLASKSGVTL